MSRTRWPQLTTRPRAQPPKGTDMCQVRHLLLLCVASSTLSYGADEALETKIENRDARRGVLILRSKKLSPDFFPKSHALSTVNVNVSLIPNVSDVIATKQSKYTIKNYGFVTHFTLRQ